MVQLLSAGVEPWLPVVPDGVALCNARGVHGSSTAELAVAGMLALLRDLPTYLAAQQDHRWDRLESTGLDGARVLVLGAGDIGGRIAAIAEILDAETTLVARTARDGVHAVDELPTLLPEHQVVVVALPLTPQTEYIVDADFLAAMPDGAVLVNIARGNHVRTDALLAELHAGRLKAFLDVTETEPLPADDPLWDAPNLILTPHVGGGTRGWGPARLRSRQRPDPSPGRRGGTAEPDYVGLLTGVSDAGPTGASDAGPTGVSDAGPTGASDAVARASAWRPRVRAVARCSGARSARGARYARTADVPRRREGPRRSHDR